MRAFFLAAFLSVAFGAAAFADESVAGNWLADLGGGVTITMNVSADGSWSSETRQKKQVVRQMKGTYTQTPEKDGAGTLVFTPTQAKVAKGKVQVETDKYELAGDGKMLKLTADGDTMDFQKQN